MGNDDFTADFISGISSALLTVVWTLEELSPGAKTVFQRQLNQMIEILRQDGASEPKLIAMQQFLLALDTWAPDDPEARRQALRLLREPTNGKDGPH